MPDRQTLILLGNANVGKSVVFGYLTGTYVVVSNYPGTTVEVARGAVSHAGVDYELIDTPGINSLVPHSIDEIVTRDILLANPDAVVVQIADAKNLKRALLVTSQLAELGRRTVLVLNMADEAHAAGLEINHPKLARLLGCPVIPTVATERRGLKRLMPAVTAAAIPRCPVDYDRRITAVTAALAAHLPDLPARPLVAQMLLTEETGLDWWLAKHLSPDQRAALALLQAAHRRDGGALQYDIVRARLAALTPLLAEVQREHQSAGAGWWRAVGDYCQHPLWGLPILFLVLWGLYEFVGVFGAGTCVDFIQTSIFGETPMAYAATISAAGLDPALPLALPDAAAVEAHLLALGLTPDSIAASGLLPAWLGPFKGLNWYAGAFFQWLNVPLLTDVLVGKFGLITVGVTYAFAIVMPIVTFFFLAFGFLEDSGYLPRLATMTNCVFKRMGLNGKAVLPMVLGLGCDTMATLTTRILYTPKERLIATLLLAIVVPCSAQIGVILGITAQAPAYIFWLYFLIITLQLFIIGFFSARVLTGETSDFLLEIPPFRWPKFGNIIFKTLYRLEWFLKEAVPLFVVGTFILYLLDAFGLLARLISAAEPIVTGLLGLPPQTAQAFVMGFLRRDYGAAGLLTMFDAGQLTNLNVLVALVTITLFIPCIANFFVIIKEQGTKRAFAMLIFSLFYAIAAGAITNFLLRGIITT